MSRHDTIITDRGSDSRRLSPIATERLSGLLAGLDRLDPILSLPTHPARYIPGLNFGRFQLLSRLGAGRFGVVLLADDLTLKRQVVIKVPQPAVLADAGLRERFAREARAAARLDHPGVVSVLESGEVDGLPYLACGYVPGPSLREWRKRYPGPVPPIVAAQFASAIATAVHHAHERGVLHCDLTPANVLLQPVGDEAGQLSSYAPLVADFGLARLIDEDPTLTRTFQVVGTPLFMAPEQARGDRRNLTARTDVYAIGVMLYDLLVGTPPFTGGTTAVLTQVQLDTPEPPRRRVAGIPKDLNAICLKSLEKNPNDRYASAAEFAEDLHRFEKGHPVKARTVPTVVRGARWASRNPISAGLIALGIAVTAAAVGIAADRWAREIQTRADNQAAKAQAEAAVDRAKTAEFYATLGRIRQRRQDRGASWSRANRADLKRISNAAAASDIVVLRSEIAALAADIDFEEPRRFAQDFHTYDAAYDPTGRILAVGSFRTGDGERNFGEAAIGVIRLLDSVTGECTRELHFPGDQTWEPLARKYDGCWGLQFSYDGQRLVGGTRSGWLMAWDLNRMKPEPVARWRHTSAEVTAENAINRSIMRLAFDRDGRLWSESGDVAVWDPKSNFAEVARHSGYLSLPAAGGMASQLVVREHLNAAHPASEFCIQRPSAQELEICLSNNHIVGRLSLPDNPLADDNTITDLQISPDGTMLAATATHARHLKLWDLVSGRLLAERSLPVGSLNVAFHPNGKELAVADNNGVQVFGLYESAVANVVGIRPCGIEDADLTPDGRFLATLATIPNRDGIFAVRVHSFEQSSADEPPFRVEQIPPSGNSRNRLALSPDGREVVTHAGDRYVRFTLPNLSPTEFGKPDATRDIRFTPRETLWGIGGSFALIQKKGGIEKIVSTGDGDAGVASLAVGDEYSLVGLTDGVVVRFSSEGELIHSDQISATSISGLAQGKDRDIVGTAAGDLFILHSDGRKQSIPQAHTDFIWAIAIGPQGWFATGSGDREVRIWDSTGNLVLTLPQTRPVRRVFWSADGHTLTILAEGERGLRRWDLKALKSEFATYGLESGLP